MRPVSHDDAVDRLRRAGLRITAPRVAVLQVVVEEPHCSVDELIVKARQRIGGVSIQGIYDVLRTLTASGLLRRIEPAGSPTRYEARVGDNHHHVVCRKCGLTEDVDCAIGEAPCLEPSATHGFIFDEAEVTFWGLCPACQIATQESREVSA